MAYSGRIAGRQQTVSAAAALLVALATGYLLANSFNLLPRLIGDNSISVLAIPAPAPPPLETVPEQTSTEQASGKASAPNRHARAAPVVAPKAIIPPVAPPPVAAAPQPGSGRQSSAGATPDPGPGSGAGGRGDGTGAGGSGDGTGGGTKAVLRSGRIRDRDYPASASAAKAGGDVEVRFTIERNGRVTRCRITRSSGDAALDSTTCRLIEERFRFRPATNARGEAIASEYGWRQSWWLERRR